MNNDKVFDNDFSDVVKTKIGFKIFISILLLLILSAIIFGYIYLNSRNTMIRSVTILGNELKAKFSSNLQNNETYQNIISSNNFTTTTDYEIESLIGNFNIKIDNINNNKNVASLLSFLSNNQEIVSANMIKNDNKTYIKLDKFMNSYYYIDNKKELNLNDILKLLDVKTEYIIDIIINNISDSVINTDIKSKYTSINFNNDNIRVRKLSFTYNDKQFNDLLINICNDMKEEKVLNELSKLLLISNEEVKTLLENIINNAQNNKINKDDILIDFSIYCDLFNNFIGYSISNNNYKLTSINENNITETNIERISSNDIIYIKSNKISNKNNILLLYTKKDEKLLELDGYITDDFNFNFMANVVDKKFNMHGNSTIKVDNGITQVNKITINFLGQDLFTATSTFNLNQGGDIDIKDIDNSKNINTVSKEEFNEIFNNIKKDKTISKLISPFKKFFSNFKLEDYI